LLFLQENCQISSSSSSCAAASVSSNRLAIVRPLRTKAAAAAVAVATPGAINAHGKKTESFLKELNTKDF